MASFHSNLPPVHVTSALALWTVPIPASTSASRQDEWSCRGDRTGPINHVSLEHSDLCTTRLRVYMSWPYREAFPRPFWDQLCTACQGLWFDGWKLLTASENHRFGVLPDKMLSSLSTEAVPVRNNVHSPPGSLAKIIKP